MQWLIWCRLVVAHEWRQEELKKISTKITEKNKDGQYKEVLTNSAEHGIISQLDFFDKEIANKTNLTGYYVVHPNDFVYNPRISKLAPVGPIKRNKLGYLGVMSPLYTVFSTHGIIRNYLEFYFETSSWHYFMYKKGDNGVRADRFSIKDSTFFEMPIPLPNDNEQRKIGLLLEKVTTLLNLHEEKLSRLETLKRGMLQKMFPAQGDVVPVLRHERYTDTWQQEKIGNLMEVTSVKRVHQNDWQNQGIRFLRARDIVAFSKDIDVLDKVFISQEQYNKYSKISGKVQIGDLLVTGVGTIGVPYLIESNQPVYFKDGNIIWFKNQKIINGRL